MAKGISIKEASERYVEKSLIAFIEGGKYARDGKPKSLSWIIGVILSSGVNIERLHEIFRKVASYIRSEEERLRLEEVKRKVEEIIEKR